MDYSKAIGMNPKYNTFDLSHDKKLSLKMGEIIPVMAVDVLPGDKFTIESSHLTRMLPLVAPVMHNVKVKMRYFFSPNRLVWDNWEDFITGPESATDVTEPTHPTIETTSIPSSLADYMGVNTSLGIGGQDVEVNALPFAHYQFIWNEYFRDQNLQDEVNYKLVDGDNSVNGHLYPKRKVAWQHDRFTSALPFTQKGPEVTLPVVQPGGRIDLSFDPIGNPGKIHNSNNGSVINLPPGDFETNGSGIMFSANFGTLLAADITASNYINASDLNIQAATINELREAMAIQKWLELNARTGNRYTEHIQAHFGVKPQDARLQRPEEFGGSVANLQFSEVLQTSQTTTTGSDPSSLGQIGGHGITASGSRKASYYAQEHGWVFAFMYVVPDTTYSQGVPAKFSKVDRYDYYQPLLAHIGEQPVKLKELYAQGTNDDENTFGYLPIYDEYRHEENSVHGLMKTSLEYWHMGRKFANPPALNASFIQSDPTDRIFVEQENAEQVIAHVYNDLKVQRKVPYYGTPMGV
jgi:hypothetical protein